MSRSLRECPAPHVDVEKIASELDKMWDAAAAIGIDMVALGPAADMLRHQSGIIYELKRKHQ